VTLRGTVLRSRRLSLSVTILAIAGVLGVSTLALRHSDVPYIWIWLSFLALSVWGGIAAGSNLMRAVAVNVGAVFLALGAMEAYFSRERIGARDAAEVHSGPFVRADEVLGYAPRREVAILATQDDTAGRRLYTVTYTFDSLGLRVSPVNTDSNTPCVLFFGGSFTFGSGVEDDEAMPYLVGVLSGFRVYNFGFQGYGPHQMLAALQQGLVSERIGSCQPEAIIYTMIHGHIRRVAGKTAWDKHGPRYVLLPGGHLEYAGHFDDPGGHGSGWLALLRSKLGSQLHKSYTFSRVVPEHEEVDLLLAVVEASNEEAMKIWPATSFEIILWDDRPHSAEMRSIGDSLQGSGIPVHRIEDILPPLPEGESYRLSPDNDHPNAKAHRKIAEYVVDNILHARRP